MSNTTNSIKKKRWHSRKQRVQKALSRETRPRLTVYRTAKHITAQLAEPDSGKTIVTVSTNSKRVMGDATSTGNIEAAKKVGAAIAEAAKEKQISEVVFNRNGFLYHGRVKALAEAAREAGLKF
ncbi:MAG: 50S ribosomal protein L18 [bacterium]|nr:50S ribosomal protein L18 [bacterium]MCP5040886.1 50S ribosomal protein L18 [bacterium]